MRKFKQKEEVFYFGYHGLILFTDAFKNFALFLDVLLLNLMGLYVVKTLDTFL